MILNQHLQIVLRAEHISTDIGSTLAADSVNVSPTAAALKERTTSTRQTIVNRHAFIVSSFKNAIHGVTWYEGVASQIWRVSKVSDY